MIYRTFSCWSYTVASIQFSSAEFSDIEGARQVNVEVEVSMGLATPVTLLVSPFDYDDFLNMALSLPDDFPILTPVDPSSPIVARGKLM